MDLSRTCQICGNPTEEFLNLGNQPPSDAFLRPGDLAAPEATFPLELFFCPTCTLVQLGYAVDPDLLFRKYVYNTGTNNSLRVSFKALVEELVRMYRLTRDDFVVDIGSNDGTLLENYLPYGIRVLGIDPSSSAVLAAAKGVPTRIDYFSAETAEAVVKEMGRARVITATNVFAHVADLDSFMRGITSLLSPDGVFMSESGYTVSMIEGMQYDSIYHEHLRYYSVRSLSALFDRYGMEIIDIERIPSHGGSIRVFASRKGAFPASPRVQEMQDAEKADGYHGLPVYEDFARKVAATKTALLDIIMKLKEGGARIAGIGAPAKGNTLLNYCGLDSTLIEYLAEKSELKIGLLSPGMHIPVVPDARLIEDQPDAALLLSWNLADELVPKIRQAGFRGKFIIPNPVPKIL